MAITSNRNVYLGVHITQNIKQALKKEVEKRRGECETPYLISQSYVTYELLRKVLIMEGYTELETEKII